MTEKDELIQLPTGIGVIVAKQLQDKCGINKFGGKQLFDFRFTKEELSKIAELKIYEKNWAHLDGIQLLPNLRKLVIETVADSTYKIARDLVSITDKDVSCVEKCTNLEFLSISNQTNISSVYLDKLTRLREVHINNNKNLETIGGLDKLTNLERLSCYGNDALQEVEKLEDVITSGAKKKFRGYSGLKELNLDVRLFPKAIGYNAKNGSYNKLAVDGLRLLDHVASGDKEDFKKFGHIVWSETLLKNAPPISIGTDDMVRMHNEACRILNDIIKPFSRNTNKIVAVEKYLAENVTYDEESLTSRKARKVPQSKTKDGRLIGPKYGANGAYDCIINKKCVCQGYTRGEQYLLGLLGIKTREVFCLAMKDQLGLSNSDTYNDKHFYFRMPDDGYHSIICIEAENGYYYSDPCWNACLYQRGDTSLPYTLLSKEEISKDHTLSPIEVNKGGALEKISRQQVKLLFEEAVKRQKTKMQAEKDNNVAGVIKDTRIRMNDFM